MKIFKSVSKVLAMPVLLLSGASAFAQSGGSSSASVDLTAVTGAFTAGDIVTGVLAIAATLAIVYVSIKGIKIVLAMLRGG